MHTCSSKPSRSMKVKTGGLYLIVHLQFDRDKSIPYGMGSWHVSHPRDHTDKSTPSAPFLVGNCPDPSARTYPSWESSHHTATIPGMRTVYVRHFNGEREMRMEYWRVMVVDLKDVDFREKSNVTVMTWPLTSSVFFRRQCQFLNEAFVIYIGPTFPAAVVKYDIRLTHACPH